MIQAGHGEVKERDEADCIRSEDRGTIAVRNFARVAEHRMGIKVLPPDVVAKIAAGEVVERPASVVKELVENAIDAGARSIRVEIQAGGKRLIRVMDDGQGIPGDEVPLAFARHATSKLTGIDDLEGVATLGFRGEALSTIAAVSRLTLTTRAAGHETGIRIRLEGSGQRAPETVGAPQGTSVVVENLFYNVPARLKFLKAEATETGHIRQIVTNYALAFPGVRFALALGPRLAFQTTGSGQLYDVLVEVFGLPAAKQMLPVADDDGRIAVSGYVGAPSLHRGRRDQIILFVNRRWVQNRSLLHAVAQAYHTFLPVDRHPVAVLNIRIDPAQVDVNVHPAKAEVKFRDPNAVFKAVQRAVRATLVDQAPVPGIGHASSSDVRRGGPSFSQLGLEAQRTRAPDEAPDFGERAPLADLPGAGSDLPLLRVIGQVQQTYIVAEGPEGLYLIDQHAAHERVLYEKLMAQWQSAAVTQQALLSPATLDLAPAHIAVLEAERETLAALGFAIEPFGGHTYRLLAVPEMLSQGDPAAALVDVLAEMAEGAVPMTRAAHERIAVIVCKRASVKGGQTLSMAEMRQLVRLLEQSHAPQTCPHGRPTMIHLSATQLAREFGRLR